MEAPSLTLMSKTWPDIGAPGREKTGDHSQIRDTTPEPTDLVRLTLVCLGMNLAVFYDYFIFDFDRSQLSIDSEEHFAFTGRCHQVTDSDDNDMEDFAMFDFNTRKRDARHSRSAKLPLTPSLRSVSVQRRRCVWDSDPLGHVVSWIQCILRALWGTSHRIYGCHPHRDDLRSSSFLSTFTCAVVQGIHCEAKRTVRHHSAWLIEIGRSRTCASWPCMKSTTLEGNESSSARSRTPFAVKLFCTMNCVRSPTTFDDGVTFTTSPSSWLASM